LPQLAHLDARDRETLDRVRRELHALYGPSLLAVALTGEAAGPAYRPGRSPLELAVLIDEVSADALRRLQPRLAGWARRRAVAPLLLDPRWLAEARDVFPIEFLELRVHHVLLHGDADPFADLPVHGAHLRLEVEKQLRGKLLHLWEAYLETRGSRGRLRALLLATPPGFAWILRGALVLAGAPGGAAIPDDPETLLAEAERRFEVSLSTLRRLERMRRGAAPLAAAELEALFAALLAEVRELVHAVNAPQAARRAGAP
jgi:hypothetical protein